MNISPLKFSFTPTFGAYCKFGGENCGLLGRKATPASEWIGYIAIGDILIICQNRKWSDARIKWLINYGCIWLKDTGEFLHRSACCAFMHCGATWNVFPFHKTLTVHSRRNAVKLRASPHYITLRLYFLG